jgi:restriction system protein
MEKEKDWLLFEQEVALLVKAFGYKTENTKPSGDLGVDVIAHSNKRKLVIQCKLYGKGNVGNKTINELLGTKIVFGADEAICVTTSGYTNPPARWRSGAAFT